MSKDQMFRVNIIGGFNKDDVNNYISRLEAEIIRLQQKSSGMPSSSDGSDLSNEMKDDSDTIKEISDSERRELLEELNQLKVELNAKDKEITVIKSEYDGIITSKNSEIEDLKSEVDVQKISNDKLIEELNNAKDSKAKYDEDYKAIKDVLDNTRIEAAKIIQKAKNNAEEIMADARKQIETQKKQSYITMKGYLEENTLGLQTSKLYLEKQIQSIDNAQKALGQMRENMEEFMNQSQSDNQSNEHSSKNEEENI